MTGQKPPDSKGRLSGFPYSILWEEFGPISIEMGTEAEVVGRAEALFAELSANQRTGLRYPTLAKVTEIVESFGPELGVADVVALSDRLYAIAAAYTLPKLQRAAGQDVSAVGKRLRHVARAADHLSELLGGIDVKLEIVLGLIRARVVDQSTTPNFQLEKLKEELVDLAASAQVCATELPRMPRGKSVNVLHARLMEAATKAIGEASRIEVEVKQADTAGRNPRPGSTTGALLFRYLDLVEPGMTDIAKERLFAKFGRSWASVTRREIEEDRFPRKWRRRTGRNDLIRDMHSK